MTDSTPLPDHGITDELVDTIAPSVGKIALAWGFIESHLRAIYWTLERTKGVPKATEHASFEEVCDHLRHVCVTLPELDQKTSQLGGLIRAACSEAKSISRYRNIVCHWTISEGSQKPKPRLKFVQWRGNDGLNVWKEQWYGVDELRGVADKSAQLGNLLADLAAEVMELLEPST